MKQILNRVREMQRYRIQVPESFGMALTASVV
jgi:hypothetical protein